MRLLSYFFDPEAYANYSSDLLSIVFAKYTGINKVF